MAICTSVSIEYWALLLTNILLLPTLLTNTEYIAQMALCMSGSIDQPTDECRSWEPLPHPANHSHTGCNLSRLIILFSPHTCSICSSTMSCHICSLFIFTKSPSFSHSQTASPVSFHSQCEYTLLLDSSPLPEDFVHILLIKMLKCSETARQSKHCGCTALCSCVEPFHNGNSQRQLPQSQPIAISTFTPTT